MHGAEGDDTIDGGLGDDEIFGRAGEDFIFGGDGGDTIEGSADRDEVFGGAGDDLITDLGGSDLLGGGDGNDTIIDSGENAGVDILLGGAGDDFLKTEFATQSSAPSILDGGSGDDTIWAQDRYGNLVGGEGADTFIAHNPGSANRTQTNSYTRIDDFNPAEDVLAIGLEGSASPDDYWFEEDLDGELSLFTDQYEGQQLAQDSAVARLAGLKLGDLTLSDVNFLSQENLNALGSITGDSDDTDEDTDGDTGDDTTDDAATEDDDPFTGTEGDDQIIGGGGDDLISGFAGNDFLAGDDGSDTIDSDTGNDTIYAGDGNDLLRVEGAYNELFGNAGDDILWTTTSAVKTGGEGSDYFLAGEDLSLVTDFDPDEDTIVVPFSEAGDADGFSFGTDPDTGDAVLMNNGTPVMQFAGISAGDLSLDDESFLSEEQTYAFFNSQGIDGPSLPDSETDPDPDTTFDNLIVGTDDTDTIDGTCEDDFIEGLNAGDLINASAGDDFINPGTNVVDESTRQHYTWRSNGFGSSTQVTTNPGQERLDPDTVYGEAGDDTIVGSGHDLDAFGGAGDDLLISNRDGISRLDGGEGEDILVGEGGDTAYEVRRFNNSRNSYIRISEQSYLNGGADDDVIVTAEFTNSYGGSGSDTFIVRDPSISGVQATANYLRDVSTSEQIILTYTGDEALDVDEIVFQSVRSNALTGGSLFDPTYKLAIVVDGETYGYIATTSFSSPTSPLSTAPYYQMIADGNISFVRDRDVDALITAEAAKALL